MFQDYALFPHMSILDNVAYGLIVKAWRRKRAMPAPEALEGGLLALLIIASPPSSPAVPAAAVAIARALVNQPRCCCSMSRWAPWI